MTRRGGRGLRAWACGGAVLAGAAVPAQEQPPTFRSDAQVVLLDVVARDKKGRRVEDLRQEELQVLEDGQLCEIASFRLVRPLAAPSLRAASTPSAPAAPAVAPAAEAEAPSRANLVVLVFDVLLVGTAPLARRGALDLVSREFPPNTWFAVFKVDDRGMRLLQPFTSDPARLASAVDFATTGDDARGVKAEVAPPGPDPTLAAAPGEPPRLGPPDVDLRNIAGAVTRQLADLGARVPALDSLYGLRAISKSLEAVRGRKTIVYFAEAREVPDSTTPIYEATMSEANRANVTIHTVDARGLSSQRVGGRSSFDETVGSFSASGQTGGGRGAIGNTSWALATEGGDTGGGALGDSNSKSLGALSGSMLERIANDTGGLAIEHTNDLGRGLDRVVEELGEYYEVVYVPARLELDGRFRKIQVKTSRSGVSLRTRSGYFARPTSAPVLLAYEMPLLAALGAKAPSADFPLEAGLLSFGVKDRERQVLLMAQVPLSGVRVAADEGRGVYTAHLSLLALVKDQVGRTVARVSHDWPIEGPLAERESVLRASTLFRSAMTLPPGRYTLEAAVQDRATGALSVTASELDVAAVATGQPAVGSLSVVRRAEPETSATTENWLRAEGVSIQPELGTPVLPAGTAEVPLFLPIYTPGAATEARLELRREGRTVARARVPLPAPEPDGHIAWTFGLPAKSLEPGRYELAASVGEGDKAAEAVASFELAASRAGAIAAAPSAVVPDDLAPVLSLAASYVLEYERTFNDLVAEEAYTQWTARSPPGTVKLGQPVQTSGPPLNCTAVNCRRTSRAEVVFVRLGGKIPWGTFRDVFEVDGRKVREREGRLEALFSQAASARDAERVRAILDESSRYNIGPVVRNINFPTLALMFLHPQNQPRFEWKRGGTRRFGATLGVEVEFDEKARPTIVDKAGQGDLPAHGRFWIDPARGTVLRSETRFDFGGGAGGALVSAEYRPEPKLALWVPSEMHEEYTSGSRVDATARYSNFRRFSVSVEDVSATVAPEPPKP